jgi:hypothetical protein
MRNKISTNLFLSTNISYIFYPQTIEHKKTMSCGVVNPGLLGCGQTQKSDWNKFVNGKNETALYRQ